MLVFKTILIDFCFKVSGNGLKFGKKSKQKKNCSRVSLTPGVATFQYPRHLGVVICGCPGYQGVATPCVPRNTSVWDTREPFLLFTVIATAFKATINQKKV